MRRSEEELAQKTVDAMKKAGVSGHCDAMYVVESAIAVRESTNPRFFSYRFESKEEFKLQKRKALSVCVGFLEEFGMQETIRALKTELDGAELPQYDLEDLLPSEYIAQLQESKNKTTTLQEQLTHTLGKTMIEIDNALGDGDVDFVFTQDLSIDDMGSVEEDELQISDILQPDEIDGHGSFGFSGLLDECDVLSDDPKLATDA